MTRFEEIGAELQGGCATIDQAVKTLNYSCSLCAMKGVKISCDRCAIAVAHEQVCAILLDIEEAKLAETRKKLVAQKVRSCQPKQRTYVSGKHRTAVCHYD